MCILVWDIFSGAFIIWRRRGEVWGALLLEVRINQRLSFRLKKMIATAEIFIKYRQINPFSNN